MAIVYYTHDLRRRRQRVVYPYTFKNPEEAENFLALSAIRRREFTVSFRYYWDGREYYDVTPLRIVEGCTGENGVIYVCYKAYIVPVPLDRLNDLRKRTGLPFCEWNGRVLRADVNELGAVHVVDLPWD